MFFFNLNPYWLVSHSTFVSAESEQSWSGRVQNQSHLLPTYSTEISVSDLSAQYMLLFRADESSFVEMRIKCKLLLEKGNF